MRGIILAGGTGSRLGALTKVMNKHLLPVGDEPMICHPLRKLVGVGIKDILLVTGTDHIGSFMELLGDGSDYNCSLTYRVQRAASGIAHALGSAEEFVGNDHCVVLLGDNIFEDPLPPGITTQQDAACVFLKAVDNPSRFGVAMFNEGLLTSIVEKPRKPPTNLAVVGIYSYPPYVFDVIRNAKPSKRGEYEITDINQHFINKSRMSFRVLSGYWSDAGTIPSLLHANNLVSKTSPKY